MLLISTWSCRSGGAVDINRNTSQLWAHQQSSTASCCQGILKFSNLYRTQGWSLPCLVTQSVTHWPCWILFNFFGFVKVIAWIYLRCYIIFWKNWYIDFFMLLQTWICQNCFMLFAPFAEQNQAQVWSRFQSFYTSSWPIFLLLYV